MDIPSKKDTTSSWSDSDDEKKQNSKYNEEGDFSFNDYEGDPSSSIDSNDYLVETIELSTEEKEKMLAEVLPLEHTWVFWYDDKLPYEMTLSNYEDSVKSLGKFASVQVWLFIHLKISIYEDFWRYWNNLEKTPQFPDGTSLKLFKEGIKPMWEDPANENGGKWVRNFVSS